MQPVVEHADIGRVEKDHISQETECNSPKTLIAKESPDVVEPSEENTRNTERDEDEKHIKDTECVIKRHRSMRNQKPTSKEHENENRTELKEGEKHKIQKPEEVSSDPDYYSHYSCTTIPIISQAHAKAKENKDANALPKEESQQENLSNDVKEVDTGSDKKRKVSKFLKRKDKSQERKISKVESECEIKVGSNDSVKVDESLEHPSSTKVEGGKDSGNKIMSGQNDTDDKNIVDKDNKDTKSSSKEKAGTENVKDNLKGKDSGTDKKKKITNFFKRKDKNQEKSESKDHKEVKMSTNTNDLAIKDVSIASSSSKNIQGGKVSKDEPVAEQIDDKNKDVRNKENTDSKSSSKEKHEQDHFPDNGNEQDAGSDKKKKITKFFKRKDKSQETAESKVEEKDETNTDIKDSLMKEESIESPSSNVEVGNTSKDQAIAEINDTINKSVCDFDENKRETEKNSNDSLCNVTDANLRDKEHVDKDSDANEIPEIKQNKEKESRDGTKENEKMYDQENTSKDEIDTVIDNGDKFNVISDAMVDESNLNLSGTVGDTGDANIDTSVFPDGYVPISATKIRGEFDSDDEGPPTAKEDEFEDGFYGRPSSPTENNVSVEKLIDIDNDAPKAEEKAKPQPEPKHIPNISHDGQTEAVCMQRKEIKPSLKDIQKVQVLACLFILTIVNNLRIRFFILPRKRSLSLDKAGYLILR